MIACDRQHLPRSTESIVGEQSETPQPLPTNTPLVSASPGPGCTPTPAVAGPTASNEIDPETIAAQVTLISEGLIEGDLSIFRDLAFNRIGYGYYKSEIWDYYSKSEFLDEVSVRLAAHPGCSSYSYRVYSPSPDSSDFVIWIFTEDWDPA